MFCSITEVGHGLREGTDLVLNVTVYSFNLPRKEGYSDQTDSTVCFYLSKYTSTNA